MVFNDYTLVYLATSIFGAYIVYKYMNVFFKKRQTSRILEIISYVSYYLFSCIMYLYVNIPILTLISTITMFLLLSLNYKKDLKNRMIAVAFISIVLLLIEAVIAIIFGWINYDIYSTNPHFKSIIGFIAIKLISYLVALLMGKYKSIRQNEKIPITFWIAIAFVPIGTLSIIFFLLQTEKLNSVQLITGISIMLTICLITFTLYDSINLMLKNKMESIILKQQNRNYRKQYILIEKSIKKTKSLQHDIKKHVQVLESFIKNKEEARALEYIQEITGIFESKDEVSQTGNLPIDSILNFKLSEAIKKGVIINLKHTIPTELSISDFDLTVILGNIIDNALESTSKINNGYINIELTFKKGVLFICVENLFDGNVMYENNKIISTNNNKEYHGFGLDNVRNSVNKYNGIIEIDHCKEKFSVNIMIYDNNV